MKKALSLFVLLFIFSCTSSYNSALKPNENDKNLSTTETKKNNNNNERISKGLYYGTLKVTISSLEKVPHELPDRGVSISILEDGSLYSEIFDRETIPEGTLKKQSDNTYYGQYTHSSTGSIYTIKIKVINDSVIYVDILTVESGSKDTTTYIGNLSK